MRCFSIEMRDEGFKFGYKRRYFSMNILRVFFGDNIKLQEFTVMAISFVLARS
jgi:hypothetical protein